MNQPTLFEQFGNFANPVVIHEKENNDVSQAILDENRHNFSHDALRVLKLLLTGDRYTNVGLIRTGVTLSPTSRIADLKRSGITVSREMVAIDGSKRKEMEYYLLPDEIVRVKKEYAL